MAELIVTYLLGRCANGCEHDRGTRLHIRERGSWEAICGAKPGRRSAGWRDWMPGEQMPSLEDVKCPKCAAWLNRKRKSVQKFD